MQVCIAPPLPRYRRGIHYRCPGLATEAKLLLPFAYGGYHVSEMPSRTPRKEKLRIFTVGHSTRPITDFINILQANGVEQLIDIRTIPKSRRNPQFGNKALADSLARAGIVYVHMKDLGGLRRPRKDSVNLAWRNASFRGYADYMQTPQFHAALEKAIQLGRQKRTVLMCAEAVPWRCHRSLVSDALLAREIQVLEIIGKAPPEEHKLTSFARMEGTEITYREPEDRGQLLLVNN